MNPEIRRARIAAVIAEEGSKLTPPLTVSERRSLVARLVVAGDRRRVLGEFAENRFAWRKVSG